jgi:hypothetical protein
MSFNVKLSLSINHSPSIKLDKCGELDFSTFLTMMHQQIQQEDPRAEILEAMRMTDKQKKGYILSSELRAKLTGLGEKLTDKEGKGHKTHMPHVYERVVECMYVHCVCLFKPRTSRIMGVHYCTNLTTFLW